MNKLTFSKTITNVNKLQRELNEHPTLSTIFDKYLIKGDNIDLFFLRNLTQNEIDDCTFLVNNFVEVSVKDSLINYLRADVSVFVENLVFEFAAENIEMGITQAGKTKLVADFLRNINYYMRSYSLYEAVVEINTEISNGLDPNLAPFITESRLNDFSNKIVEFLT